MQPGKKKSLLRKTTTAILILLTLTVPLIASLALAHKVNVFAWVEGDTVFVEGYYGGKRKAHNSLVEVFNKAGVKLLEGRTNDEGQFSFEPPEKTELRIVLTAGMGHKNDFIIAASDFGEVKSSVSGSPPEPEENQTTSASASADPHQLEDLIDKALDRKLAPIIKLIRETRREGPTLTEILGGIGYIFGLLGVAVYFSNRKKKERGQRSEVRDQQNVDSK